MTRHVEVTCPTCTAMFTTEVEDERARTIEECAQAAARAIHPVLLTRGTVNEMAMEIAARIRALKEKETN